MARDLIEQPMVDGKNPRPTIQTGAIVSDVNPLRVGERSLVLIEDLGFLGKTQYLNYGFRRVSFMLLGIEGTDNLCQIRADFR